MSKITFPIQGRIKVPFSMLMADPLLVLRKFPMVDTLEAVGPLNYFVVTQPFALTSMIRLRRRWHINLELQVDKLVWAPVADDHADDGCDGWIQGECTDAGNGYTNVNLTAIMEHRLLNVITTAVYRNAIHAMGYRFMAGFESNCRNPEFENTVPVYQA
jgi:hypothetical protein